jgi:hypothetical protein
MAPFFTGFTRGLGGSGFGNNADRIIPVRFFIEIFGAKGSNFGIQTPGGTPSPADPARQGGGGGYTKLDMTVPTAYSLDINSPITSFGGGGPAPGSRPGSRPGGPSGGFSINDQWMAIVGGGGGAAGFYDFNASSNPQLTVSSGPAGGSGAGGYGGSGFGSVGGNATPRFTAVSPTTPWYNEYVAGAGGGGSPGGAGGGDGGSGGGGGANIRIFNDQGITTGYLTSNPDIKMTYITDSNGVNSEGAYAIITNYNTNNTYIISGGSVPLKFIAKL